MTVGGSISLIITVMGASYSMSTGINPYALCILGVVFFFAGSSLLKYRKDTDQV